MAKNASMRPRCPKSLVNQFREILATEAVRWQGEADPIMSDKLGLCACQSSVGGGGVFTAHQTDSSI